MENYGFPGTGLATRDVKFHFTVFILLFQFIFSIDVFAHDSNGDITNRHGFDTDVGEFNANSQDFTCLECHEGSYTTSALDWTDGSSGTAAITIPPGISKLFGVKLASPDASASGSGFNLAARKETDNLLIGTFLATDPSIVVSDSQLVSVGVQPTPTPYAPLAKDYHYIWGFAYPDPGSPDPTFQSTTFRFYSCINQVNGDESDSEPDRPSCGTSTIITVTNTDPVAINENGGLLDITENGLVTAFDVFNESGTQDSDGHTISFGSFLSGPAGYSPSGSTFSFSTGTNYDYLDTGESVSELVSYTVTDVWGGADTGTATISITGLNDAPVAADSGSPGSAHATVNEGGSVNASSVLVDVSDVDATEASIIASRDGGVLACNAVLKNPAFGTLTAFNPDGTFSYQHNGTIEAQTSDSFEYCAYDQTEYSNVAEVFIGINLLNDLPQISNLGVSKAFTEQTPVIIDSTLTITDADSTQLDQAQVRITGNYESGKDVLVCPASLPPGITGCASSNDLLTLTGTAHIANYQIALRAVKFDNNSNLPSSLTRTIGFTVRDTSSASSISVTKSITPINQVNDAPVATNDGATGFGNGFVAVSEGDTVNNGTDGDLGNDDLRDNDLDPESASSALTTTQTGCSVSNGVGPSNASAFTLDTDGTFSYTHNGTNTTSDSFSYCVTDGVLFSTTATVFIDIASVNDAPTVTTSGGNTNFTEQVPVVIDSTLTLADVDSTQFNQAQVRITTNYETGTDMLVCPTSLPTGITSCSFSADLLTFSGTANTTSYQTALRAVKFDNNSDQPSDLIRTISFTLRDTSLATSVPATKSITVAQINDPPIAANDGATGTGNGFIVVSEGGTVDTEIPPALNLLGNDSDPDSSALTTTQTGCSGGNGVIPSSASSFTLRANGTFSYTHNGTNTTSDSFSYCVNDGALFSTKATAFIEINAVNDPPVISGGTAVTMSEDGNPTPFSAPDLTVLAGETGTLNWSIAPGGNATKGTATVSGVGNNEVIGYTPQTGVNGSDSFSVRVTNASTGLFDDHTINITISSINAPPTLADIVPTSLDVTNNHAYEDTSANPFTFTISAVASDIDSDDINDGNGSLSYALSNAPVGMNISNAPTNPGEISWNPPVTGTFGQVYGPVTVSIEDGNEDGSPPNTTSFSITVSPPDDDSDMVANYDDLCPADMDETNADFDDDGIGDICDPDDDDDGMPDNYENANSLNPLDASDAELDSDGDGISNLQEYFNSTDPNIQNLVIDATGYLTPFELTPPDPTTISELATAVVTTDYGPYRPGSHTITWTAVNSSNSNLGSKDQTLDIRPLLNFGTSQLAEEGAAVNIGISLNGNAAAYPVTVNYLVSGTATNPDDHDAVVGSVVFNYPSLSETITFNVLPDALVDSNETVVFTIDSATNAAIGSSKSHQVTIVEENVTPEIEILVSQVGAGSVGSAYVELGAVTVDAIVNDVNSSQSHSLDWSGTSSSLSPPTVTNMTQWNFPPVAGNYLIDIVVTDNGSPPESTRISRLLNILATAPTLTNLDTDNDGTTDDIEGFDDSDGDGIPDYLDANDAPSESNLIPNQTVDMTSSSVIATDSGLKLSIGNTARASGNFGALLTDSDISRFGSVDGGAPINPVDSASHFGGIYDFAVSGVIPGSSVRVIIPLQSGIPKNAEYRKFNPATGWTSFVEDNNNSLASAVGELGACPEPGSNKYRSGLNYLDNCIELTIKDGGPNDTDNTVNGQVADPGAVGLSLSSPQVDAVKEGGGRLPPVLLLMLVLVAGFTTWRQIIAKSK